MAPQRKQLEFEVAAEAPNKPSKLVQDELYPQGIMCLQGSTIPFHKHISPHLLSFQEGAISGRATRKEKPV
jgi:hypothetical protein